MTMKATNHKCNPKLSSKDDLPGMFESRNNPDQTVEYLNFRQTICRIFLFFSSQTYIILYTTDSAILPDKKGEKRKLTMPELHADDEIRSSNDMHI